MFSMAADDAGEVL